MEKGHKKETKDTALGFYSAMFITCHCWMIYYFPQQVNGAAVFSFILQHLIIFSLFLIIDSFLNGKKIKMLLGGFAFIYTLQVLANGLLHSVTSITITESLTILTLGGLPSDYLLSFNEAGFSPIVLLGVLAGTIGAIFLGGILYRFFFVIHFPFNKSNASILTIIVPLIILFIMEQASSHNNTEYFTRREYPSYLELFKSSGNTLRLQIPKHINEIQINNAIKNIKNPANRKNVIFIILESFRHDMINKSICPNLYNLSQESLQFTKPYGDSIYTSISWNILLMNCQPYTTHYDINSYKDQKNGSLILRLFNRGGYKTYLASSANFSWNKFDDRFIGQKNILTEYYSSYENHRGKERNELDSITTEKVTSWIRHPRAANNPFIIWAQLDGTHYKYYFDKETAAFKPFPEYIGLHHVIIPKFISHVFNRYKNSAHNVDLQIGKIVKALKDTGSYDNTAIIIVSDHGEGFAPGRIGHSVFHENIKKMALIMKLPGIGKRKIETPTSHRAIIPTLVDYLQFRELDKSIFIGKSVLGKNKADKCILTFHGSIMLAELNCFTETAKFRVTANKKDISFTPYRFCNQKGQIHNSSIENNWKSILTKIIVPGNKHL